MVPIGKLVVGGGVFKIRGKGLVVPSNQLLYIRILTIAMKRLFWAQPFFADCLATHLDPQPGVTATRTGTTIDCKL